VRLGWPSNFGIFLADEELSAGDIDPGIPFGLRVYPENFGYGESVSLYVRLSVYL
jgi:hypothetical protein